MATYKVQMQWGFIVEAPSMQHAKGIVAELTNDAFLKVARLDEFAYEDMAVVMIDQDGAGVDARL